MTGIEQISGLTAGGGTGVPAKQLGQEDFLELLVAQLKNQDPTNPVDNAQFLGQIAQFSMVSGIDDLKGSFNAVAGHLYGSQAMQASSLIGREVLSDGSTVPVAEGGTVEGVLNLPAASVGAQVQVLDEGGGVVGTLSLNGAAAGPQAFRWEARNENGEPLPAGRYSFSAQAAIDGSLEGVPLQLFRTVESVSVDRASTSIRLHLSGSDSIGLSQVSEFR